MAFGGRYKVLENSNGDTVTQYVYMYTCTYSAAENSLVRNAADMFEIYIHCRVKGNLEVSQGYFQKSTAALPLLTVLTEKPKSRPIRETAATRNPARLDELGNVESWGYPLTPADGHTLFSRSASL